MNAKGMLVKKEMPFCPGCGYNASVMSLSNALVKAGYCPDHIVLVSDIGCSGLVDPLFRTHTIHGLHGRSAALAMGISLGLDDDSKKVISIQGDGGATIGLQHILEAARRNVNLTHVVLNNLVYGMTGGQISGLSSTKFKDLKQGPDRVEPFDICDLAHKAGASYVARVTSPRNFEDRLLEAILTKGFSLVELPSMCQPHGIKKLKELKLFIGPEIILRNERNPLIVDYKETLSLLNGLETLDNKIYRSQMMDRTGMIIAGSAGGGIQTTAKLLAATGILSGLHTTMKGSYPVTVGTGFSVAEVLLSKTEIFHSGLDEADIAIVVSQEGLAKVRKRINKHTLVIVDQSVDSSDLDSYKVIIRDFIKIGGKKGAALSALSYWIDTFNVIKKDALIRAVLTHQHSQKFLQIIENALEPDFIN